ncbi:hypothetical protein MXD60_17525, partial [Frankia sp. AgB32]|nr:hypothetical protein [Frankia sp. AgB32]
PRPRAAGGGGGGRGGVRGGGRGRRAAPRGEGRRWWAGVGLRPHAWVFGAGRWRCGGRAPRAGRPDRFGRAILAAGASPGRRLPAADTGPANTGPANTGLAGAGLGDTGLGDTGRADTGLAAVSPAVGRHPATGVRPTMAGPAARVGHPTHLRRRS